MKVQLTGGWEAAGRTLDRLPKRFPGAVREVVRQEGDDVAALIQGHLEAGDGMAPLSPLSGHQGAPLAGLARHVEVRQLGDGVVVSFRGASPRGLAADTLAELHARGAAFNVTTTDRQRRFLMAVLRERGVLPARAGQRPAPPGSPVVIKIRLPPRDPVGAAARAALEPSVAGPRIARAIAVSLDGALGDGRP